MYEVLCCVVLYVILSKFFLFINNEGNLFFKVDINNFNLVVLFYNGNNMKFL